MAREKECEEDLHFTIYLLIPFDVLDKMQGKRDSSLGLFGW